MPSVVNSRGAYARAERLQRMLQAKVAETMPAVAESLALSAVTRAPSVDEEYALLMVGEGGTVDVPRQGDRSGDTDGRIRLSKSEDTYLANAIPNPANVDIQASSVSFGSIPFLDACTVFSYWNKRWVGKNEWTLSDEHTVGPYFQGIEYGAMATIVPIFILGNGHKYPLRPANEPEPGVMSMTKSFPVHYMFNPASLESAARATITAALAQISA